MKLNRLQKQKVTRLRLRIALQVIVALICVGFIVSIISYRIYITNEDAKQVKQLNQYISSLKTRSKNFETKISDIKKYKEYWESSDNKKKNFDGIDINQVNTSFNELSEKYNIVTPTIKVSIPEILKGGIYERQVSDVMLSNVKISFNALDDIRSIFFIKDFVNSLPGYIVITSLQITKTKSYSNDDLMQIRKGEFTGAISANLEFYWYVFKRKEGQVTYEEQ